MDSPGLFQAAMGAAAHGGERPCLPWQAAGQKQKQNQKQKQDAEQEQEQAGMVVVVPPVPVFSDPPSLPVEQPLVPDLRELKRAPPAAGSSEELSQQLPAGDGTGGKPRRACSKDSKEWTVTGVTVLLDAYEARFEKLHRGNFSSKDWEWVAATVNERCNDYGKKTKIQCKNKIENLKKKFRLEESRMGAGGGGAGAGKRTWFWYERMEGLVGPVQKKAGGEGKEVAQSSKAVAVPGIPGGIDAGDPGFASRKPGSEFGEVDRMEIAEPHQGLALAALDDAGAGKSWAGRAEDAGNAFTRPEQSGAEGDREAAGPSNGSTEVKKRGRQDGCGGRRKQQRCPAAELAASFSRFVDAMMKIEADKMELLRQLLLPQNPRNPP